MLCARTVRGYVGQDRQISLSIACLAAAENDGSGTQYYVYSSYMGRPIMPIPDRRWCNAGIHVLYVLRVCVRCRAGVASLTTHHLYAGVPASVTDTLVSWAHTPHGRTSWWVREGISPLT